MSRRSLVASVADALTRGERAPDALALDLARAAARERSTDADGEVDSVVAPGSVEEDAIVRDDRELLRDALKGLPAIPREVIVLAFFGGLTHRQIADRLTLPEGTVKGRMRLGLNKLRSTSDGWQSPRTGGRK